MDSVLPFNITRKVDVTDILGSLHVFPQKVYLQQTPESQFFEVWPRRPKASLYLYSQQQGMLYSVDGNGHAEKVYDPVHYDSYRQDLSASVVSDFSLCVISGDTYTSDFRCYFNGSVTNLPGLYNMQLYASHSGSFFLAVSSDSEYGTSEKYADTFYWSYNGTLWHRIIHRHRSKDGYVSACIDADRFCLCSVDDDLYEGTTFMERSIDALFKAVSVPLKATSFSYRRKDRTVMFVSDGKLYSLDLTTEQYSEVEKYDGDGNKITVTDVKHIYFTESNSEFVAGGFVQHEGVSAGGLSCSCYVAYESDEVIGVATEQFLAHALPDVRISQQYNSVAVFCRNCNTPSSMPVPPFARCLYAKSSDKLSFIDYFPSGYPLLFEDVYNFIPVDFIQHF